MKRRIGFALSFLFLVTTTVQPLHAVDKEPRKVLTGWIPYYSVKTVLPLVRKLPSAAPSVAGKPAICDASQYGPVENLAIENSYLFKNKDLMREVMPFWYSLKSPTVIRDDYVSGNPSWPIADTVCLMRRAGLQVIPTMTDGTDKLVLSGYLANASTRTTIVKTIVFQPDQQAVDVSYRMLLNNGEWKVYDIMIDGVSLITNYRSAFSNLIQSKGTLNAVIDDLAKRNAKALAVKKS